MPAPIIPDRKWKGECYGKLGGKLIQKHNLQYIAFFQATFSDSEGKSTGLPDNNQSPLIFVQQALAKEEEYDITPLATLASSLPKRRTTAVPKSSNSMIPTSYTVPDEDYTRKMFDKFIHHLRQV